MFIYVDKPQLIWKRKKIFPFFPWCLTDDTRVMKDEVIYKSLGTLSVKSNVTTRVSLESPIFRLIYFRVQGDIPWRGVKKSLTNMFTFWFFLQFTLCMDWTVYYPNCPRKTLIHRSPFLCSKLQNLSSGPGRGIFNTLERFVDMNEKIYLSSIE